MMMIPYAPRLLGFGFQTPSALVELNKRITEGVQ
jgi:hypothetical protein